MLFFPSQNEKKKKKKIRPAGCTGNNKPGWRQTNIFLSLALYYNNYVEHYSLLRVESFFVKLDKSYIKLNYSL